jgi:tetratricopeptide (TPR) repeat protein
MPVRKFLLLLACLYSWPCLAQSQPTAWRDSLRTLNRQIDLSPRSTDLRLKKAAVNIELEQWEYAAEEYGRVLQLDPKNLAALYYRAYTYTHLNRPDLAQGDYETFLTIVPRHFEARLGMAMTKRSLGRQVETMDELNLLVQQFPDSAMAYAARANYETELKQYDAALYDWDEAIRLRPGMADFIASKAQVLRAMKRDDEAEAPLRHRHTISR